MAPSIRVIIPAELSSGEEPVVVRVLKEVVLEPQQLLLLKKSAGPVTGPDEILAD